MSEFILYEPNALHEFCGKLLVKVGLSQEDALIVSDSLIFAELRNKGSHGLVRLPGYIERIEKGLTKSNAYMKYVIDEGAICLLDADNGMGQVAGYKAMRKVISIAQDHGIGMVVVRDSNHFGIASYYSIMASDVGMIGCVMSNASPAIAPFGTKIPLIGANPLAVSIPSCKEKPIVLDMAMSTVARGKIRMFAMKNREIPLGWALDSDGNVTNDSKKALEGSLIPIGGAKGSGLALIIDILCGVLSGTSLTGDVRNTADMSEPSKTGHVFIAINISKLIEEEIFRSNIDLIIKRIKSLPSIEYNKIYMPGENADNQMKKRKIEGIPIEGEVVDNLNKLAERFDIQKI